MSHARHRLTLALDYGQFTVTGSVSETDTMELLVQAQAKRPSSGNGGTVLVLSPHQNNFAMIVDVEVWDARPPADRKLWQQVSEEAIVVDEKGLISLGSPTSDSVDCAVPAGHYLLEVSGRGFVNYGWPGSTEPGDVWRLRLWPHDGSGPLGPKLWEMPGYGTPAAGMLMLRSHDHGQQGHPLWRGPP